MSLLGSMTPVGERARRQRWGVTTTFYLAGCVIGGAATGAALGGVGTLLVPAPSNGGAWTLLLLAAAGVVGLILDAETFGWRLPTPRRQVDDEWLYRYRGWLYGFGFGVQLGTGVLTVVTTSAVYVAYVGALLSRSWTAGAAVGFALGATRGLLQLRAGRVKTPQALVALSAWLERSSLLSQRVGFVAQAALVALTLIAWSGNPP